jgi:hypothetical protein
MEASFHVTERSHSAAMREVRFSMAQPYPFSAVFTIAMRSLDASVDTPIMLPILVRSLSDARVRFAAASGARELDSSSGDCNGDD